MPPSVGAVRLPEKATRFMAEIFAHRQKGFKQNRPKQSWDEPRAARRMETHTFRTGNGDKKCLELTKPAFAGSKYTIHQTHVHPSDSQ